MGSFQLLDEMENIWLVPKILASTISPLDHLWTKEMCHLCLPNEVFGVWIKSKSSHVILSHGSYKNKLGMEGMEKGVFIIFSRGNAIHLLLLVLQDFMV